MEKDYLLNKWLKDELSDSEMQEFRKREDYDQITEIIDQAKAFKASEFSEVDKVQIFQERISKSEKTLGAYSWIRPMLKIAAAFVIGLGLFYFLKANDDINIETVAGEQRTITLPNESVITLNAQSEISYDASSWEDERVVNLDGEAFFDVSKGATFRVITDTGIILVLGTEFNVKRRPGYFEVSCFEGKVRVVSGEHTKNLKAGDYLRLMGDEIEEGSNLYGEPQWTRNLSSFQRVPLSEVVADLERQYNIEVEMYEVEPQILFTGAFAHDDLDTALKSITEPLNLDYKHKSTRKVSIYPREN